VREVGLLQTTTKVANNLKGQLLQFMSFAPKRGYGFPMELFVRTEDVHLSNRGMCMGLVCCERRPKVAQNLTIQSLLSMSVSQKPDVICHMGLAVRAEDANRINASKQLRG
jgi:hypothetical protein